MPDSAPGSASDLYGLCWDNNEMNLWSGARLDVTRGLRETDRWSGLAPVTSTIRSVPSRGVLGSRSEVGGRHEGPVRGEPVNCSYRVERALGETWDPASSLRMNQLCACSALLSGLRCTLVSGMFHSAPYFLPIRFDWATQLQPPEVEASSGSMAVRGWLRRDWLNHRRWPSTFG